MMERTFALAAEQFTHRRGLVCDHLVTGFTGVGAVDVAVAVRCAREHVHRTSPSSVSLALAGTFNDLAPF